MSNSYTNYTIVNPATREALFPIEQKTRAQARKVLALVKAEGIPAKIQANEYELKSTKFIR